MAIALALLQKVTSPTSPTLPAFSARHFFLTFWKKELNGLFPIPAINE
jgi:hypothetical protein